MSDFEAIFEWLKGCPALYELWVVSSLLEDRRNIVQLKSSANMYDVDWQPYRYGGGRYIFNPVEPYFFDVDIICYRAVYSDQNTYNLDAQNEVQAVCDWLIECQNNGDAPQLETPCYQIECLSAKPFIRDQYVYENDTNAILVDYAVTVRFYTDNPAKRRTVIR